MSRSNFQLPKEFSDNLVVVEAHRRMMLDKIDQTIRMAEVRCLPFDVLLKRIEHLWDCEAAGEVVYRACSEPFSHNQMLALAESARRLADAIDDLPSSLKAKSDRAVKRILSRMSAEIASPIVVPWLDHDRKLRREIAYRVLRDTGLSAEFGPRLLDIFGRSGDQECLKLLARNPAALAAVNFQTVLEKIEEEYWRMRVVQSVLLIEPERGRSLSARNPHEFVWAVGRLKDASLLPDLRRLLEVHASDLNFISIYAWCLGQLGATEDLAELRNLVGDLSAE